MCFIQVSELSPLSVDSVDSPVASLAVRLAVRLAASVSGASQLPRLQTPTRGMGKSTAIKRSHKEIREAIIDDYCTIPDGQTQVSDSSIHGHRSKSHSTRALKACEEELNQDWAWIGRARSPRVLQSIRSLRAAVQITS